jgi:hypothetical protein
MSLRLNGSTSGYTEIDAPALAGSNTLVLPTGNGSDGNILGTDGAGNLSWVGGRMVLETAQAATSGTSVDFTGIPSWVKRVTVVLSGVSTNGTSLFLVQLGDSGGIEATGYVSGAGSRAAETTSTAGFVLNPTGSSGSVFTGVIPICTISTNLWVTSGVLNRPTDGFSNSFGGTKTLSGTLTQLRITTVNGTDTFDAGSLNLLLEG